MIIYIPTALRRFTRRQALLESDARTLQELLTNMEASYPALTAQILEEGNRLRAHVRLLVNHEQVMSLEVLLRPEDEVHILCAVQVPA